VALLISNAPDILSLFGPDFVVAAPALAILAGAQFINLGTGLVGVVLFMAGRQNVILGINLAALVVNAALCILLIPQMGLIGAAVGMASAVIFLNVVSIIYGHAVFCLNPFSATYLKATVAAVLALVVNALLLRPLLAAGVIALGGGIVCIGLVYIVAVILMDGKRELSTALNSLRRGLREPGRE